MCQSESGTTCSLFDSERRRETGGGGRKAGKNIRGGPGGGNGRTVATVSKKKFRRRSKRAKGAEVLPSRGVSLGRKGVVRGKGLGLDGRRVPGGEKHRVGLQKGGLKAGVGEVGQKRRRSRSNGTRVRRNAQSLRTPSGGGGSRWGPPALKRIGRVL